MLRKRQAKAFWRESKFKMRDALAGAKASRLPAAFRADSRKDSPGDLYRKSCMQSSCAKSTGLLRRSRDCCAGHRVRLGRRWRARFSGLASAMNLADGGRRFGHAAFSQILCASRTAGESGPGGRGVRAVSAVRQRQACWQRTGAQRAASAILRYVGNRQGAEQRGERSRVPRASPKRGRILLQLFARRLAGATSRLEWLVFTSKFAIAWNCVTRRRDG